ncbi:CotH kinase family protein [Glutamicibacter soli]
MYPRDKFTHSAPDGPRRGARNLMTMAATLSIAAMALAGCSPVPGAQASDGIVNTQVSAETASFFNSDSVHEINVEADEQDVAAALEAYESEQSKEWISATVTIDGTVFLNAGLRLKGNSTLRQADTGSDPQDLPWQIRLDKFVDGQSYAGRTQFVVRTNTSQTSLNEAVALALLGEAGLATEQAAATRFTLNGSAAQLRLVIDNPSDELYSAAVFAGEGITYKADSSGDYSYRGASGSDYDSAFSVESGAEDLTPIAEFLDFVNNSSDADFAAQLAEHLDVDQFATYLAMQDLVANSDDIDGPGNNSFLRYDTSSGTMTVVAWDQNLSFGGMGGMGSARGDADGPVGSGPGTDAMLERFLPAGADVQAATAQITQGILPEGAALPEGMKLTGDTTLLQVLQQLAKGEMPAGLSPQDGQGPGQQDAGGSADPGAQGDGQGDLQAGRPRAANDNPLVTRFLANTDFSAKVEQAKTELTAKLYDSGAAQQILDTWSALLTSQAGDLVDADTVASEAEAISAYFTKDTGSGASQAPGLVPGQAPQRGARQDEATQNTADPDSGQS